MLEYFKGFFPRLEKYDKRLDLIQLDTLGEIGYSVGIALILAFMAKASGNIKFEVLIGVFAVLGTLSMELLPWANKKLTMYSIGVLSTIYAMAYSVTILMSNLFLPLGYIGIAILMVKVLSPLVWGVKNVKSGEYMASVMTPEDIAYYMERLSVIRSRAILVSTGLGALMVALEWLVPVVAMGLTLFEIRMLFYYRVHKD